MRKKLRTREKKVPGWSVNKFPPIRRIEIGIKHVYDFIRNLKTERDIE